MRSLLILTLLLLLAAPARGGHVRAPHAVGRARRALDGWSPQVAAPGGFVAAGRRGRRPLGRVLGAAVVRARRRRRAGLRRAGRHDDRRRGARARGRRDRRRRLEHAVRRRSWTGAGARACGRAVGGPAVEAGWRPPGSVPSASWPCCSAAARTCASPPAPRRCSCATRASCCTTVTRPRWPPSRASWPRDQVLPGTAALRSPRPIAAAACTGRSPRSTACPAPPVPIGDGRCRDLIEGGDPYQFAYRRPCPLERRRRRRAWTRRA